MADGVMPEDYAYTFAKGWIPTLMEAFLDYHRAMHQYQQNQDGHIEDILEAIAKLQTRRLCLVLREFVDAYVVSVGIEPNQEPDEESDEDDSQASSPDASQGLIGATETAPLDSPSLESPDEMEALMGLS